MSWLQRPQLYWNFSLPPIPLGQSKPSSLKWCRGPFTDPILMGPESDQGHHPPAGSMSVYLAGLSFRGSTPENTAPVYGKALANGFASGRLVSWCVCQLWCLTQEGGTGHLSVLDPLVFREAPAHTGLPWAFPLCCSAKSHGHAPI